MAQDEFEVSDWINRLGDELNTLAQSVTGEFRDLANQAIGTVFLPKLNSDTTNAIELLRTHRIIEHELIGAERDTGFMMVKPTGGSWVELDDLVKSLVRSTVIKGDGYNVAKALHKYLTLGDKKRLPGYELIFFRGLKVENRVEIGEGAFITSYDEIVKLGLVKLRDNPPLGYSVSEYRDKDVLVFVRKLTWGPGIEKQHPGPVFLSFDKYANIEVKYLYEEDIGVVFGFLSIVTRQGLEYLSTQYRGDKFMENIDPHFMESYDATVDGIARHSMEREFSRRLGALLTEQDVSVFHDFMKNWRKTGSDFKSDLKVNLVISRLVSSVSRDGRGFFWIQDGILDISIALEVMYEIDGPGITRKLSERASHFLGANAEERDKICGEVRDFYQVRSYIIHGDDEDESPDFEQAFDDGYKVACNTLSKLLCRGNRPDWDNLVMGDRQ